MLEITVMKQGCTRWLEVADYAANCSWRAGHFLADAMRRGEFFEWERVLVATERETICGFCTVAERDCIPKVEYTPYIGYLFVGEEYRGKRLSWNLIERAMEYLGECGFDEVYLVSDHENLYEKYGFEVIERKMAPWGTMEKIYRRKIPKKKEE